MVIPCIFNSNPRVSWGKTQGRRWPKRNMHNTLRSFFGFQGSWRVWLGIHVATCCCFSNFPEIYGDPNPTKQKTGVIVFLLVLFRFSPLPEVWTCFLFGSWIFQEKVSRVSLRLPCHKEKVGIILKDTLPNRSRWADIEALPLDPGVSGVNFGILVLFHHNCHIVMTQNKFC